MIGTTLQALLLLASHGQEAIEQMMGDGDVPVAEFRSLVEGVGQEVPSLFQKAAELSMYWGDEAAVREERQESSRKRMRLLVSALR